MIQKDQISQQQFAEKVVQYVLANSQQLGLPATGYGGVPDTWTYYGREAGMPVWLCGSGHGIFTQVYSHDVVQPHIWKKFQAQYYSPEARLLVSAYQACNQSSPWFSMDMADCNRQNIRATESSQNATWGAILDHLKIQKLITTPNSSYQDSPGVVGIRFGDRIVDFPKKYKRLRDMYIELTDPSTIYDCDMPRIHRRYAGSIPEIFMIGETVKSNDLIFELVAKGTDPKPKIQRIRYVLAECLPDGHRTFRYVGDMWTIVLEVYKGTLTGHIQLDEMYGVPTDAPDESLPWNGGYDPNWANHSPGIIGNSPILCGLFGF